ncbi:diguanylate cyclase [Allorhizobium sp. NPDC080224]|uniref:diguanylate cyclase n=1 Tax=Allorhizobium sp. NPDC080224 TaxID=3390547 RepID=UPI003D04C218
MENQSLAISFLAQLGVISLALTICSLIRDRLTSDLTLLRRVANGILFGSTASLLMFMPGELLEGFRFDLRIVPLAVVGLISGPVGALTAALVTSAVRIWLGGAGVFIGVTGIILASLVAALGAMLVTRGHRSVLSVLVFSLLNAAVALIVLALLPPSIRAHLVDQGAHYLLLGLNFLGTAISTFYVRVDTIRRENARLNELHRQIVSALPDALNVKDLSGRFLIANNATAQLMGARSTSEMIGKTDFDYYSREDATVFLSDEQQFIANPRPTSLEQQFERAGQTVWLHTIKAPYFDDNGQLRGIVSHTADVSAQKLLQAELESTRVLLQTATNEMADGLAMFDGDGRLVMWNRHYLSIFPYVNERTCRGRTLGELLTAGVLSGDIQIPDDAAPLAWVEEEVHRSETATDSELQLSDGRWVCKSISMLETGGWVTLYSDISEQKAAAQLLERLATRDSLTDLANRRVFDRTLETVFDTAKKSSENLSLMMIDVDHFKTFNDTYGHPAGDKALQRISAVLQASCRAGLDLVARYGGEEFAVILPSASLEECSAIAERMIVAVRDLHIPHAASPSFEIRVSIGIAEMRDDLVNSRELVERCDQALYEAKAAGRDTVRSWAGAQLSDRQSRRVSA